MWGKTNGRDDSGERKASRQPAREWLTVPAEHLRIVPEALWRAAHKRMAGTAAPCTKRCLSLGHRRRPVVFAQPTRFGKSCAGGGEPAGPRICRGKTYTKCRFANARPDPVLRYRSNATAPRSSRNSIEATSSHGRSLAVCVEPPELWTFNRDPTSLVNPT